MNDTPPTQILTGHLWLRAGGSDLALPLARVRHVMARRQLRTCRPRPHLPAWWRGMALANGEAHPLLGLGDVIGAPRVASGSETAVVIATINGASAGLVCDRVLGIIPEGTAARRLPPALFGRGDRGFPEARLWAARPVVTILPDLLLNDQNRKNLDRAMETSRQDIDLLWELNELEQKLAATPSERGYLDLAARYHELGWEDEAGRMRALAAELKKRAPSAVETTEALHGPFNRRVSVELLQVLHLTSKSGELRLQPAEGPAGSVWFDAGRIVDARIGNDADALSSLRNICALASGAYQFRPGLAGGSPEVRLPPDTAALIAELARQPRPDA